MTTPVDEVTLEDTIPAVASEGEAIFTPAVEETPAAPTPEADLIDLSIMDPQTFKLILPESGVAVEIQPLKTRQFFKLLKILTRGASGFIGNLRLDADMDTGAFVQQLLTWTVLSIPEAEQESIEFIQSMVLPADLVKRKVLDKREREQNDVLLRDMFDALDNPELEDTVAIFQAIVTKEGSDIQRLGKRLQKMFRVASQTGQLNTTGPTSPTPTTQSASTQTA